MNKILLKNKDEFDSFYKAHTGYLPFYGNVTGSWLDEPESYPCVLVWEIKYDGNGPDTLEGEYVYISDFNE